MYRKRVHIIQVCVKKEHLEFGLKLMMRRLQKSNGLKVPKILKYYFYKKLLLKMKIEQKIIIIYNKIKLYVYITKNIEILFLQKIITKNENCSKITQLKNKTKYISIYLFILTQ